MPPAAVATPVPPRRKKPPRVRSMNLCISDHMPRSQHLTTVPSVSRRLALLAALALVAGCGAQAAERERPPDPKQAKVALLEAPKRPGEVIVRGDLSPASHGPYAFDGRYVAR